MGTEVTISPDAKPSEQNPSMSSRDAKKAPSVEKFQEDKSTNSKMQVAKTEDK